MATPPAEDAPESPAGRRALVVARAEGERARLVAALSAAGWRVAGAAPDDAWAAAAQHQPAVLVVSVDGAADSLVRVREALPTSPYVPILAVHGVATEAEVAFGFQHGADDFLLSPYEPFELALRLEVLRRTRGLHDALRDAGERLQAHATTDELTGLLNRRTFEQRLDLELRRVARFRIPVACIFLGPDRFERVEGEHGRAMSSHVIKEVARVLVANLRDTDHIARHAGEVFALALPGCGPEAALDTAQRLAQLVAMTPFRLGDAEVYVTVSAGAAVSAPSRRLARAVLLDAARAALARARQEGGNRTHGPAPASSGEEPA